jgi:predicted DNA-binding transcriptional regulator YafY
MRASRLVSLLLLLQNREQLTAAELARELEVSERTIHRDVEALSASGVPIYAERGPGGGIRLVDGYRTRLTGLTAPEAEAVFLSGLPGPAAELGLGTVMAAAQLKVLSAMPRELRPRAQRLLERFHLDASGWFVDAEPVPHLATLADGVWESRRVLVEYRRGGEQVERLLGPLGLVLKGGIWYVVAEAEGQVRTYRVARVRSAELREASFQRPPGFELAAYWSESIAAYEREVERVDVTVRVRPSAVSWLADFIGNQAARSAERLDEPDPAGWVRLRLRMNWPGDAPGQLLGMGSDLEVLSPPRIRQRVAEIAHEVAAQYGADS